MWLGWKARMDGIMTPGMKVGVAGIVLGLILLFVLPSWAIWAGIAVIVAAALAISPWTSRSGVARGRSGPGATVTDGRPPG
jgi:hypothetical protein